MTTTQTKPKSHGVLQVQPEEPARPRWLPKALRDVPTIQFNLYSHAEECSKYGLWKMRALRTIRLCGIHIEAGEDFQVPGNTALNLYYGDGNGPDADFIDESGLKAREDRLAKETAE